MSNEKYNFKFNNTTFKINLKIDDKILKNDDTEKKNNQNNDNNMLNSFFKLLMNNPTAFLNNPEFKKEFNNLLSNFEKSYYKTVNDNEEQNSFDKMLENDIKVQKNNISSNKEQNKEQQDDNNKDILHFGLIANEDKCISNESNTKMNIYSLNDIKQLIDENKYVLNDIYI